MKIVYAKLVQQVLVDKRTTFDLRATGRSTEPGNCKELRFYRDHSEFGPCLLFSDSEGHKVVPVSNVSLMHVAPEEKAAAKR